MYLFRSAELYESLDKITNDNAQGEYYLPDCLSVIRAAGGRVDAVVAEDETEIMGVNSPEQLALAEQVMKQRQ
jgi:bifunctional UDP-N-acetylglucosamine pyrophosphorylase/glucosamine-1-phosphate N-acetyltransferase